MIYSGDNKDIKKELQKVLIDKNITLTDIAHNLQISKSQLNNTFNKTNFSFNDLYKMLQTINVDLEIAFIDKK